MINQSTAGKPITPPIQSGLGVKPITTGGSYKKGSPNKRGPSGIKSKLKR